MPSEFDFIPFSRHARRSRYGAGYRDYMNSPGSLPWRENTEDPTAGPLRPASSRTGLRGAVPTYVSSHTYGMSPKVAARLPGGGEIAYDGDLPGLIVIAGLFGYGVYRMTR